jgi:hypothetical protein
MSGRPGRLSKVVRASRRATAVGEHVAVGWDRTWSDSGPVRGPKELVQPASASRLRRWSNTGVC